MEPPDVHPRLTIALLGSMLAACTSGGPAVHGSSPSGRVTPSSTASRGSALGDVPRGDLLYRTGRGSGTFRVELTATAALYFACQGPGTFRVRIAEGEGFRGTCSDGSLSAAVYELQRPLLPAVIRLQIIVGSGTAWRVAVDSHEVSFER